jgi:hypothetical protein
MRLLETPRDLSRGAPRGGAEADEEEKEADIAHFRFDERLRHRPGTQGEGVGEEEREGG